MDESERYHHTALFKEGIPALTDEKFAQKVLRRMSCFNVRHTEAHTTQAQTQAQRMTL
jgi:hypothetical protein